MKSIIKLLRNILLSNIEDSLFNRGIEDFNNKKYYAAHESWEELWSEYKLNDALFIQGLIQLSVAFFHITNLNLKGSKNLFEKCLPKLQQFSSSHRGLNLDEIIIATKSSYKEVMLISHSKKFNWNLAPKIIKTI